MPHAAERAASAYAAGPATSIEISNPGTVTAGAIGYSDGVIELGTIDSGIDALRRPGPIEVTIERQEER